MTINLRYGAGPNSWQLPVALLFTALFSANGFAAVQDVMLQTMNGKIVTGVVNDETGAGTLGQRVFGGQFSKVGGNLRTSNPGFFGLRTNDPVIPPGASGFPSQHAVSFDLLPMSIGAVASNLFYWDGSDANGGGVDLTDVNFVVPNGIFWDVFDANFANFTAGGSDQIVNGGLIDTSSSDIWPDGVDSGPLHRHLALQVRDSDGNSATTAAEGIYLFSWQVRSIGFDTSDPIFFVHRTPLISDAIRDVAVNWVEDNLEMLTSPPQTPGDYNGNGVVDALDYVLWRIGSPLRNEVVTPHATTEEDYEEWRARYGNPAPIAGSGSSAGYAVPEPTAWPLLLPVIGGCLARRRRRR